MTVRKRYHKELNLNLLRAQVLEASKKHPESILDFEYSTSRMKEGLKLINQKNYSEAVNLLEAAAKGFEKLGISEMEKICFSHIADLAYNITFDRAIAIKSFSRITEISSDPQEVVGAHNCLATFYLTSNDGKRALEHCEKAEIICQEIYDKDVQRDFYGCTIFNTGDAYYRLGNIEKAEEYFNRALKIFKEIENPEKEAKCLEGFGRICLHTKKINKSIEYFQEALKIFEDNHNQEEIAETLKSLAIAYATLYQTEKSIELLRRAATIHRQLGLIDPATDDLACIAIIERTRHQKKRNRGENRI